MDDSERRKCARRFLELGNSSSKPSRSDFTAYGQASLEMARGAFELLDAHGAKLFATMIPRGIKKPTGFTHEEFLRKDHVFLFERYFYFLESQKEYGLIVMDETDKSSDRKFVGQMEGYFRRTATGRNRSAWIVPSPMFVASDMTYAVQAADICLYCINWGFRDLCRDDTHESRLEIMSEFTPKILKIQWSGDGYRDGKVFRSYGITMVPDPYTSRA